jgi:hypothetical protein
VALKIRFEPGKQVTRGRIACSGNAGHTSTAKREEQYVTRTFLPLPVFHWNPWG